MNASHKQIAFAITLSVLAGLLLAFRAFIDIAPPHQPPGSNLEPGEEFTQVRMEAETVLIDVLANAPADSLGRAQVTADFTMRNLGSQSESMAVRFPIAFSDGWSGYPEIENIEIRVNGVPVSYRRVDGPAGWNDSIGNGEIIVRLPYEANPQNVILDEPWFQGTTGATFSGREVHWSFQDLEPDREDNFEVYLVMPLVWEKVLVEQENVAVRPGDGEAWGRLGKAYKEIWTIRGRDFRRDEGGIELYQLSVEAYEQATTLLPDDALWHAGFAELLSIHADLARLEQDTTQEMVRALGEIHRALELAPTDPKVQEIALNISFLFPLGMQRSGEGYDFLWLTATPPPPTVDQLRVDLTAMAEGRSPTAVATETEQAHTPTPATVAAQPDSQTGQPQLCGAALIPLLLSAAFISRRKARGA